MSDWRDDARCLNTDPEMWFEATPGRRASNRDREDHAASVLLMRAICAGCPVSEPCLEEALRHDDAGFRGGLTADERRALDDRTLTLSELAGLS
jgi:predicted RecB family nuclease